MNIKHLTGNVITAFAAQGVSMLASIVMSLVVPKVLGVTTFGYWQLFIFYSSYSGFFQFGLNDGVYLINGGLSRSVVDKRSINSQFLICTFMQLVVGASISIFAFLTAVEEERVFVLLCFSIFTVILDLQGYLGYVFQAMNETKLYSFATMLERGFFLLAMLFLVIFRVDAFEPYVIFYVIAKALSLFYCIEHAIDIFHSGLYGFGDSLKLAISSIKVGFSLMLANIADMLILGVARALVDNAWGIEVFGKISFSLSMVNFFILFVSQASMVLFPALRQGSDAERRSFYQGIRDMMEIAFPGIYLLYFPMAAVLSLWLPQYADSMHYFALLIPVCVFNTKMDVCCTTFFKVLREERLLLRVNLIAVTVSAVFALIGIYALNSLEAVLIGAVACIVVRSLWSERHLDYSLRVKFSSIPVQEVLLTVAFVILALVAPSWCAVLGYALLYGIYLFANRKVALSLAGQMRRVLANY